MKFTSEIFMPLSSKIDWCEPNYVVTSSIAEFWNTISNFPFLIIPPIAVFLNKEYSMYLSHTRFVNIVWALLFITGLGSVYFHSTLSLFGQFCDEVGILWICLAVVAFFMLDKHLPKYFQMHRDQFQAIVFLLSMVSTFLGFLKPEINHFFLFLFVPPAFVLIWKEVKRSHCPDFQNLGKNTLMVCFLALAFWVLDRCFCPFWISVHFPYLHGFWHILVAYGGYQACVCFAYSYAMEKAPEKYPSLKFRSLTPCCHNFGLWYIAFDNSIV